MRDLKHGELNAKGPGAAAAYYLEVANNLVRGFGAMGDTQRAAVILASRIADAVDDFIREGR